MRRRRGYSEGSVVVIPLKSGRVVLGVVAREDRGDMVLYVMPEIYETQPTDVDVNLLALERSVWGGRVHDTCIEKDKAWSVLAYPGTWSRSEWPMPLFEVYSQPHDESKLRVADYGSDSFDKNGGQFRDVDRSSPGAPLLEDGYQGGEVVSERVSRILGEQEPACKDSASSALSFESAPVEEFSVGYLFSMDGAIDLSYGLMLDGGWELLDEVLELSDPDDWDVDKGAGLLAAAELVAVALGSGHPEVPDDLRKWAKKRSKKLREYQPRILAALDLLTTHPSELHELWSEQGQEENLATVVDCVVQRLRTQV